MKHVLLIAATLFVFHQVPAQSLRSYVRAGDEAFRNKNYAAALQLYGDVLKRQSSDLNLWWKYGESARMFQAWQEAQRSYEKIAAQPKHLEKHPLVHYRIAEVQKSLGHYDEAIRYFEKFLEEQPGKADPKYFELAKEEIAFCQNAKIIAASPAMAEVKHPGKEINSAWNEFAPTIVGDTLFYASNRFDKKGDRGKQKQKMNKVMLASKGGRGREPGRGFPSIDTAHIAHTAFSPDGHYVFYTVCKDIGAVDKRCELWLTAIDRRNRWLPGIRLPEPINLPGYTTTQPNIGYDKQMEGPVLWFASDRPGGKGKMDLWSVPLDTNFFCPCNLPLPGKKMTYLPDFETPVNAEALNTPENDGTPYFHKPTQRLYFSSDGRMGLGGYDVYFADKHEGHHALPENAGPGINTSFNDLYFFLKEDGQSGYLSSNRPGSFYLDEKSKTTCHDIFSFVMKPAVSPPPSKDSLPEPMVSKQPDPEPPVVPVLETPRSPTLADFQGLPLYFDNDEPDKRTRRTSTQKSYEETVRSYLERQDEYRTQFSKNLKATDAELAEQQVDDFFEDNIRKGFERLSLMTEVIAENLAKGEKLEVLIKGFTSPRAETDYNLNLGKRRISSVRNHFESWSDGQLKPYLQSGQLIITETSFGETTAKSGISDRLNDERNSIYHPDAARERRVEIVEVRKRR
ncbi:MAG TPA: tetratricopeptide repeat protein [Saprospiraceae bacterium]|nr:tetratricopeptide repeat protein [Saprospiraceae bacterium]